MIILLATASCHWPDGAVVFGDSQQAELIGLFSDPFNRQQALEVHQHDKLPSTRERDRACLEFLYQVPRVHLNRFYAAIGSLEFDFSWWLAGESSQRIWAKTIFC